MKNNLQKTLLIGFVMGIIIFMIYLFNERDKEETSVYINYYSSLVQSIENLKSNMIDIYYNIKDIVLSTLEVSLDEKVEIMSIIDSNINQCKQCIKNVENVVTPFNALATKNDIISFFNDAIYIFENFKNVLTKKFNQKNSNLNFDEDLSSLEDKLEIITKKKISGYTYQ